jgi:hypothetical protein
MVMNEFESTLASAMREETDRTTVHLDTADAARQLEARLDLIDRDRRHRTWATALIAAAVLVAGVVYGGIRIDSPTSDEPAQSPVAPSPSPTTLAYQMLVGDARGVAIHADVTLDGNWHIDSYPLLQGTRSFGGLAVYRPSALAAGNGCLSDEPNRQVGQTPQKLAQQLAQLPRSTLLQPPTPVQKLGRQAVHLQLRINPDCGRSVYRVAETANGGHGISYGPTSRHVVIDFWVENVRGVPVVIETWHQDETPSQMVNQIARSLNSLTFTTGG